MGSLYRKILPQLTDAKLRPTDAMASFGIGVHPPLETLALPQTQATQHGYAYRVCVETSGKLLKVHLNQGTRPLKKLTHIRDIKRYLQ